MARPRKSPAALTFDQVMEAASLLTELKDLRSREAKLRDFIGDRDLITVSIDHPRNVGLPLVVQLSPGVLFEEFRGDIQGLLNKLGRLGVEPPEEPAPELPLHPPAPAATGPDGGPDRLEDFAARYAAAPSGSRPRYPGDAAPPLPAEAGHAQ